MTTPRLLRPLVLLAGAGLLATACGSGQTSDTAAGDAESSSASGTSASSSTAASSGSASSSASSPVAAADGSRVTLTYDGGLLVLDGATLDVVADLPLAGFNRVNPAGDGRTVMVSTADGFQVLDTGTAVGGAETEPQLTDLVFAAPEPGHVVRHAGRTVLFSDGTGEITVMDTEDLTGATELPETEVIASEAAHHGVAIELEDGTLLSTLGTSESRSGVRVLDPSRAEVARNEECPSVHGEGTLAGEIAVFGCSDGVLVYRDGTFTKFRAPDEYGRMGNAYVSETSPILVGDYNSDPDSEGSLLSELVLLDTSTDELQVVDLPEGVRYTWRDVGRGPADEIILLSADGTLNSIDPATGEIERSWDVIAPWEGPEQWQDPHPALVVHGDIAFVTEPAAERILAVDLTSGEILAEGELPATPNEIAVATGSAAA